ncbi:MAG TPA: CPBP family intramembrane metalloprotease [Planctomycetes bacterium]|nr:CPBP family intramembrane metalloprotease [Planctomycetota bacterium]
MECPACGQSWYVHSDLGGHQLMCQCGTWINVPGLAQNSSEIETMASVKEDSSISAEEEFASDGHLDLPLKRLDADYHSDNFLRSPEASEVLQNRLRTRWTNRTLVELFLVMLALLGPHIFLVMMVGIKSQIVLMPFSSLVSGTLILLIGLTASQFTFGGMKKCDARYLVEAVLVAVVAALLADWWMNQFPSVEETLPLGELREVLGLGGALFCIAVTPAVFEELAFRGLLQGRLCFLLGKWQGILVTAAAFALAHGVTLGFPFHMGIGVYLCWCRDRSGSLLPCMLMHFVYNGILVVAS